MLTPKQSHTVKVSFSLNFHFSSVTLCLYLFEKNKMHVLLLLSLAIRWEPAIQSVIYVCRFLSYLRGNISDFSFLFDASSNTLWSLWNHLNNNNVFVFFHSGRFNFDHIVSRQRNKKRQINKQYFRLMLLLLFDSCVCLFLMLFLLLLRLFFSISTLLKLNSVWVEQPFQKIYVRLAFDQIKRNRNDENEKSACFIS